MIWLTAESVRQHQWVQVLPLNAAILQCQCCHLMQSMLRVANGDYPHACPPRLEAA